MNTGAESRTSRGRRDTWILSRCSSNCTWMNWSWQKGHEWYTNRLQKTHARALSIRDQFVFLWWPSILLTVSSVLTSHTIKRPTSTWLSFNAHNTFISTSLCKKRYVHCVFNLCEKCLRDNIEANAMSYIIVAKCNCTSESAACFSRKNENTFEFAARNRGTDLF